MSIRAGGVVVIKSNITVNEIIILSFEFSTVANKMKIGFQQTCHPKDINKNTMSFDITDDPLDINAECLFGGDGVRIYLSNTRMDNGEDLYSRMSRLQNFFNKVLSLENVEKIILNINFMEDEDHDFVKLKIEDFADSLVKFYHKNDNWTPCLKCEISL